MKWWGCFGLLMLAACNNGPEQKPVKKTAAKTDSIVSPLTAGNNTGYATDSVEPVLASAPLTKRPSGIYEFVLPYNASTKILHTIAFTTTGFRLQEEYPGRNDSVVITEGTWAPSQGFIWLYKGQVVRGRYSWQNDTLQYYSPRLKQKFSLVKLLPATTNTVWQTKAKEGAVFSGIGTEPFWSIELTAQDSLVLSMPHWAQPLHLKLAGTTRSIDSTVYNASGDSLQVTVYPYFCSDGMSDFVYPNKVRLQYKALTLRGCAIVF